MDLLTHNLHLFDMHFIDSMQTLLAQAAPPTPPAGGGGTPPPGGWGATGQCLSGFFTADSAALNCAEQYSKYSAEQWENIWQLKVGNPSGEFVSMLNVSKYIAGPAVALWAYSAMKDLARNGLGEAWPRMVSIILLVFVLYANQAKIMRETVLATRALFNYQNIKVLEVTNADSQFETRLGELADYRISEAAIKGLREQCNGITDPDPLLKCLENAKAQAEAQIKDYVAAHPGGKLGVWLQQQVDEAMDKPIQTILKGGAVVGGAVLGGPVGAGAVVLGGALINNAGNVVAQSTLATMNILAQNIVELTWLFTALAVPIPLAMAFYPGGTSALIGWAIGFCTVGLFKLNLNIATSLIVSMIYERGPGNANIDMALLSFAVISVASLMTAGGGFALFQGITTFAGSVAAATMKVGTMAAGKII